MTIDKSALFQKISAKCNYIGEEVVEKVYYALLRVILDELKNEECKIYLPDWGNFKVVDHPAQISHHVRTKERRMASAYKQLVFTPCEKLRKYIKS